MIKSKVLAHSVGTVTGVVFVVCRVLAAVVPNFIFSIGQSWFHTVNVDSMRATQSMSLGLFLVGLVSSVVVAWIIAYAIAELYNRWAKE